MSTLPPYVTNDTRLILEDDHPVVGNENTGLRKAGQSKLEIPNGPLAKYVPEWLATSGVLRHLLDALTAEEGEAMLESFAHPDEKTTEARQVRLEGQSLVKNQREHWLEKRAVAVLVRAFPDIYRADEDPDGVLTHAGFRAGTCEPGLPGARNAFVLRFVALQLVIRRGMEIYELLDAQQGETRFPLFGYTVTSYNETLWDAELTGAEPPGTATKQTLSKHQQRERKRQREPPVYDGDNGNQPDFKALYEAIKAKYEQRAHLDWPSPAQPPAKRARTNPGKTRTPHPNMPSLALTGATLGKRTTTLSRDDACDVLQRGEVDPCDCVDARVWPEIVTKFTTGATITAAYIHGLICPQDQQQTLSVVDATDGNGFTIATGNTSARKIKNIYDILAVNNAFIDSVASVQPELGTKLRQVFPTTVHRAERRFNGDTPKTVACWDRHVAGWMKGLSAGANISLAHSKGYADLIDDEMTATRADTKKDDAFSAQVKQLQRQTKQLQRNGGGGGNAGGGNTGSGNSNRAKSFPNATDQDCVNFLAGKDCKILDADGKCIFNHDGLVKGSDPDAINKRYNKIKA